MTAAAPLVAVCQFSPDASPERNRERIAVLVAAAAQRGADVAVLPEYSNYFTPEMDDALAQNAEGLDGGFVSALRALAAEHDLVVVAGMVETADAGRVHNTVVAVSDAGVQAVYRKQHLYDAFGHRESDWIEPGDLGDAAVFEARSLRFGLMTCYDLRFPELARSLVDAGAEVLVVPAAWVAGPHKVDHWRTLVRARAIENTVFVVAAGQPGPRYAGHSLVVDPLGEVLAEAEEGAEVITAVLEHTVLERARRTNPSLANRRL